MMDEVKKLWRSMIQERSADPYGDEYAEPTRQDALDRRLFEQLARRSAGQDLAPVRELLEMGANPNAPQVPMGAGKFASKTDSAFCAATRNYDLEAVALLGTRAKPNQAPQGCSLPLVYAASRGGPEMVQALLDVGADPELTGEFGSKPLVEAVARDYADVCAVLAPKACCDARFPDGSSCFAHALSSGAEECAQILAPHLDPHAREPNGKTPLLLAAQAGRSALVELLLPRSDIHAVDRQGQGLVDLACGEAREPVDAWMSRLEQARELGEACHPAKTAPPRRM